MLRTTVTVDAVGLGVHAGDILVGCKMTGLAVRVDDVLRRHARHDGKVHIAQGIHVEIPGAFLRLKGQLRQQRRRSVTFVASQLGMGGQLVRPCGLFHDMTTGTEGTRIRHPHTPRQPCQHEHAQRNAAQQYLQPRALAG